VTTPATVASNCDGALATVVIDRPERRNAVDRQTVLELGRVIGEHASSPEVAVVVLRGRGTTFCAGADGGDLGALLQHTDDELMDDFREQLEVLDVIGRSPAVTVAAVQGVALGFGVALAASCDLVVAAADARFGLPEIKLGMAPAMVLPSLRRRLTPGHALRLAVGARTITASEAEAIGLVDIVLPADAYDAALDELLRELSAHDPDATRRSVRIVRGLADGDDVDIPRESCETVRSPAVARALERFGS
jgi:methylglutaconyl-CoA hydratase